MTDKIRSLMPESIDTSTRNILDPITKESGNTIGDLFHLIFGKISFERNKQDLKEQYSLDKLKIQYDYK